MTLRVDFDIDLWLYVPQEWPWEHHPTFEQWRDDIVRLYTEAYSYSRDMQTWLSDLLEGLMRGVAPHEHRFVYFPVPHEAFEMVSLYEMPLMAEIPADSILGTDDVRLVGAPVVTPFDQGRLGEGTKSVRFVESGPERSISGVAHWWWRLEDRDVLMIVGDSDLVQFDAMQPILDEFARNIELADRDLAYVAAKAQQ